jgi:hypothetical protein
MALASKSPTSQASTRRIWKKPTSKAKWLWFSVVLVLYAGIYAWFFFASKQQDPDPASDPFRIFGIVAFSMVLVVASYSVRRRFVRVLPGRVQDWLWLHTWFGIGSILIAFLHEGYTNILHDYDFSLDGFTGSAFGMSALYGLIFLVLSGIVGRLLDTWLARVIAAEANRNGIGIAQSLEEYLHELELTIERLSAGKSAPFKHYCEQALKGNLALPNPPPLLPMGEQSDFQRATDVLATRARLIDSLRRQKRARFVIKAWRYIHIPLACLALLIIGFHGLTQLTRMILHLPPAS